MHERRRLAALDGALVLGCLGLTVLATKAHWSATPSIVIAVSGVTASLAQWWRRRLPQLAAVAGAVGYALSGNPGPWLVGVYSGASYAPRRQVWAIAMIGWAGFAGLSVIDDGSVSWPDLAWAALATAVVAGAGLYMATRRELTETWRERAEIAETRRRLRDDQARAAERTRIAREMHDVLAHKVSLIALHAGALELSAGAGEDRVRTGAALIRVTAREALQELRHVLGVLQTGPQAAGDSFADLASLVAASDQAGQRVELDDRAGELPPGTARVVYRIVQEGLTNARKHAPGSSTTISVERAPDDTVTVVVQNTPPTGAPADLPGSGAGLVGLAERIRLVGGIIHSGPAEGGWRLEAVLPRPEDEAEVR